MALFVRGCFVVLMFFASWAMTAPSDVSWNGPKTGPLKVPGKCIAVISQDLKNGGIMGFYRHFKLASRHLSWKVTHLDGRNNIELIKKLILRYAQMSDIDAIVLGGISLKSIGDEVLYADSLGKVVAGWHVEAEPGSYNGLLINIATPSASVAAMATEYVINESVGDIGAVLFTDSRFEVANSKTSKMKEIIELCDRCKVLTTLDINLGQTEKLIPQAVSRLNESFGNQWTHTLAINDLYFDSMNYPLISAGRTDIRNVSAGDGSAEAISRILGGLSQQVATVAEPLGIQGWQMADELNRYFAGQGLSGYVSEPILITWETLQTKDILEIDNDIPYKEHYLKIWRRGRVAIEE